MSQIDDSLTELARLRRQRPSLSSAVDILAAVIPIVLKDEPSETVPEIDSQRALEKLAEGIPLLRGERPTIDARRFTERWDGICNAVDQVNRDDVASQLVGLFCDGGFDLDAVVADVLEGRVDELRGRLKTRRFNFTLTTTLLRLALFPVFMRFNEQLQMLRGEYGWKHGYCPTCGSWPLLGEFRGLDQARFLRCGLCAADWAFPRLLCPFCSCNDHAQLGYFHIEGEEDKYRAATCDNCRHYVKMVSTLAALDGPELLVADTATLHLDLAAAERGFVTAI